MGESKKKTQKSVAVASSNGSATKVASDTSGGGFFAGLKKLFVGAVLVAGVVGLLSVIVALNQRESALRADVERLQGEINGANANKKAEKEETRTLRQKILYLEKNNAALRVIETDYEKSLAQLTDDVRKLITENEELTKQNTQEFAQLDSLRRDIVGRDESLRLANRQLNTQTEKLSAGELQIKDLEKGKAILLNSIKDVREENSELRSTMEVLKDRVRSMSEGVDLEKGQTATMGAQLESAIQERDQLIKQVKEMRVTISDNKLEIEKIQGDASEAKKTLAENEALLKGANDNLQTLKDEFTQKQMKFDAQSTTKEKLENDLEAMRGEITAKSTEIMSLKGQIEASTARVNQLQSEKEEAEIEKGTLRGTLDRELVAVQNQLASLEAERNEISGKLGTCDERMRALEQEVTSLGEEKAVLRVKLAQLEKPISG